MMANMYMKCQWLMRGSLGICGKNCREEYCKIHLSHFRKGSLGTKPCKICGRGVINKIQVCESCGYNTIMRRMSRRGVRAFEKEFERLAAIDI
jgi:hypothetical protein